MFYSFHKQSLLYLMPLIAVSFVLVAGRAWAGGDEDSDEELPSLKEVYEKTLSSSVKAL